MQLSVSLSEASSRGRWSSGMAARVGGEDEQHDEELSRLEVSPHGEDTTHVLLIVP